MQRIKYIWTFVSTQLIWYYEALFQELESDGVLDRSESLPVMSETLYSYLQV